MGHAEIETATQRGDRRRVVAAIDVPGSLANHRRFRTTLSERTLLHRLPSVCRKTFEVGDKHGSRAGFRDVELALRLATDGDVGAGCSCAGFDPRNEFADRREHEDMAERG